LIQFENSWKTRAPMPNTVSHSHGCSPDLAVVRQLVSGALQLEAGETPTVPDWDACELEAVSALIARHRLAISLTNALPRLDAPDTLFTTVNQRAKTEQLLTMPLLAAVREVIEAMQQAGIRCLIFKGIALAMQTTGNPLARGTGDIDVLIAPETLSDGLKVLGKLGFQPPASVPRRLPSALDSWAGRYARWADYEVTIKRGNVFIDLHWAPTDVRSLLPDFDRLWAMREEVVISGSKIPTFAAEHALIHACCHAAKDQWQSLRSLIDIERLARQRELAGPAARLTPRSDGESVHAHPAVLFSALVTHGCISGVASRRLTDETLGGKTMLSASTMRRQQRCLAAATRAQSVNGLTRDTAAWYLALWRQSRLVSRTTEDRLRDLAMHVLPPVACFDQRTGTTRSFPAAIGQRIRRVLTLARSRSEPSA